MADRYMSIAKPARKQTALKICLRHICTTSPCWISLWGTNGGPTAFYVTALLGPLWLRGISIIAHLSHFVKLFRLKNVSGQLENAKKLLLPVDKLGEYGIISTRALSQMIGPVLSD